MNGIYRLREPNVGDEEQLWIWRNSERIRGAMKTDRYIARDEHHRWFADLLTRKKRWFYLFTKSDQPLGIVQFTDVRPEDGTCSWGFYLGEPDLPRGTGTYLAYLGLCQAFGEDGFRKVSAQVLRSNMASYRLHKKLGFRIEGCLRQQVVRGGGYEDVIALAMFKEEWEAWRSRLGIRMEQEVLI